MKIKLDGAQEQINPRETKVGRRKTNLQRLKRFEKSDRYRRQSKKIQHKYNRNIQKRKPK